jgi:hypothetical protein
MTNSEPKSSGELRPLCKIITQRLIRPFYGKPIFHGSLSLLEKVIYITSDALGLVDNVIVGPAHRKITGKANVIS